MIQEEIDEDVWTIQVNLDDLNPEQHPYVMEKLLAAGAYDVYLIPIIMKKGRPGILLHLLTSKESIPLMESIIFKETSTLGLRYWQTTCHRLQRDFRSCETPWGQVRVKVGYYKEECVQFAPEYEDCAKVAKANQVSLQQVYDFVRKHFSL